MVAYNFAPRFASLVESGAKVQTIRGHRKRHAREGEAVQLFTAMRTRACRKLVDPDPVGIGVLEIKIYRDFVQHPEVGGDGSIIDLDNFARDDGFADWSEMRAWWDKTHGIGLFEGVLIRWRLQ